MKKNNQLVPTHNPHEDESNMMEVVVRCEVEEKSNQNQKKRHENGDKVVRDNDEDGDVDHNWHAHREENLGREEENINNVFSAW